MKKNTFNFNYKYNRDREKAVDKAILFIKKCPYKGTAIKIELEAFLGRYNPGARTCSSCSGRMETICKCEGLIKDCVTCDGRGYIVCVPCDGKGQIIVQGKKRDDAYCQRFILDHVSKKARDHLIFSKTYADGDTEFTFTLPIQYVRDAIEFIKAFNLLAEDIGGGMLTNGSGMHIAILNSPTGVYPGGGNHLDSRRYKNFVKSMTHLMPALFFLASPDDKSRALGYRQPKISSDKYSAINAGHKIFEYRVFETCYQRPEAILDNLCVIANTLKYYSYRYQKHSFFNKIGEFGFEDGYGLDRFFKNEIQYRALMAGIRVLKPSYKTIAQLKRERNYDLNLAKIRERDALKDTLYAKEFHAERKSVAELKEYYKAEYKEGVKENPTLKQSYPTSISYVKACIPELSILKEGKDQYINKKKKLALRNVSKVINI